MNIEFQPGEMKVDTWTIMYTPPTGTVFRGKLTITNKRLLYDTKMDSSVKNLLPGSTLIKWGREGLMEIDKADITDLQVEINFMSKRVIVTLTDGSRHIFNYGALNIDRIFAAIQKKD
jgi:hypothetical protein